MAFFKRNVGGQKRKLGQKRKSVETKRPKKPNNDDEISSSEDDEDSVVEGKRSLKSRVRAFSAEYSVLPFDLIRMSP